MATPDSVLDELKRDAQRKASFKMYYAACDVFRDYKGSYTQETAVERERLATEYHNLARAAEEARWGGAPAPEVPAHLLGEYANAQPAPPPRPVRPAQARPAQPKTPVPPKRKPVGDRPKPSAPPRKPQPGEEYQIDGDKVNFNCRWCKEPVIGEFANAGKLMPCPKCDMLLRVPGGKDY